MEDSLRVAPTSSSTILATSQQQAPTITEESTTTALPAASNNSQDKCEQQLLLPSSRAETAEKLPLRSEQKPPPFPPQHGSSTIGNRSSSNNKTTVTGGPVSGASNIGSGSFRKPDCSSSTSVSSSGYVVKSHSNIHPPFGGNQRRSSIIAHVPPFNQSVSTSPQSATKSSNSSSASSSLSSGNNNNNSNSTRNTAKTVSSAPVSIKRPAFNSSSPVAESGPESDSISSLANERFGDSTLGNYLPPDAISVFHTLVSSAIDQCLKNSSDSKVRVSIFSNLYDSITKNNPSGAGAGGARTITSDEPSEKSEKEIILLEAQKESELSKSSEMMETTKSTSIPTGDRILANFPTKKNGFSSSAPFHTAIGIDEEKSSKILSELSEDDSSITSRLRIDEESSDLRKKRPSVLVCSDNIASKCRKNGSGDQSNSESNDVEASSSGRPLPPTSSSQNKNNGSSSTSGSTATGSSSGSCNEYKNCSNSSKLATVQASINYYKESNVSASAAAAATAVEITSPKAAVEQEDEEKEKRRVEQEQQISSDGNNRSTPPVASLQKPHHHHQQVQQQQRSLSSESSTLTSYNNKESSQLDDETLASDNDDNDDNDIVDNDSEEVLITSAPSAAAAYAQKEQGENSVTSLRKLNENFFNANNSYNDAQQQQRARVKSNSSSAETPSNDSNNAVEQLLASSSSSDMVNRLTKYLLEQHLFNGYSASAKSGPGSMAEVGSNVENSKDVLGKLGFNSQTSELATAVASAAIAVMNSRVDQPRGYGSETAANTGLFSGPYSTPSPKPIGVTPIQIMKDEPLNLTGTLQQGQKSRKENSSSVDPDSGDVATSKESRPGSCDLGNESSAASPDIVVMDQVDSASLTDLKFKRGKSANGGSNNGSRKGSLNSEDVVKDILSRSSASVTNGKDESTSRASTPTSTQDGASVNTKQASDSNPLLQNVANSAFTGEDKNSFRRLCHSLIQSEILKLSNCEHAIEKKVVQHVGKVSFNNSNSINHQLSAALQKQVTSPESVANSHPAVTIAKFLSSASFPKGETLSNGSCGGEEVKTIQPIPSDNTSSSPSHMEKQQFVLTSSAISNNSDFTLITEPSLPTYEQLTELSQDLHATLVAINPRSVLQKHQIRALTLNCKRSHTAFTGLKMLVDCLKERLSDLAVTSSSAAAPGSVGGQSHLTQLGASSGVNPGSAASASVLSSGAVSSKRKMSPMVSHATGVHDPASAAAVAASSLAASSPPSKIVKVSSAESLPAFSSSRSYNNPQHSLMNSAVASNKLLNRPLAMSYPDEPPRLLAAYSAHNPTADAAHLAAVVASTHSAVDSAAAAHLYHYRTPLASSTITSNSSGVSLTPGHVGVAGATGPPLPHHPGTHAAAAAAAAAVASENAVALHARLQADYRAANSLLKHPSQHTPPHPGATLGSQTAAAVAAAAHSAYGNKLHAGGYIEGCPCTLCVQNIEKHRAKVAHALIKSQQQQQHGLGAHMGALSSATGAAIHHNSTAAANSQPPPPHPNAGPPGGVAGGPGSVGVPPPHPHNHASDAAAVAAAAQYQSAAAAAEHLRLYPTYPSAAHVPKLLQAPNATPAAPASGPGGHRSPILSSTPGVGVGLNKPPHGATSNHFGATSAHYPHVSHASAVGAHELETQLHHLGRFAPHLNSATPSGNTDPAAAILALHHESQLKAAAAAINAAALQQQHHQLPPPPPNAHYGRHGHPSAAAAVAAAAAAAAQSGAVAGANPGAPHSMPPTSTAGAAGGPPPPGSGGVGSGAHVASSPLAAAAAAAAAHSNTNHHSSPYSLALAAASVSPMESSNAGGLNYSSSNLARQPNPLAPGQFRSLDPQTPVSTPKSMEFSGGPVSSTANSNSSGAVKPAGSQCANCGGEAIYLCSGCRKIWYCSQECQVKAWERHYVDCFGAQVR